MLIAYGLGRRNSNIECNSDVLQGDTYFIFDSCTVRSEIETRIGFGAFDMPVNRRYIRAALIQREQQITVYGLDG